MNLLQIRQQFIKLTGREDLATTVTSAHDTDNGADYYINGGIRDIELEQIIRPSLAVHEVSFAIGDYEVLMREARFIRKVYFTDAVKGLVELDHKTWDWMAKNYPLLGSETSGTPSYWTTVIDRKTIGGRSTEYYKLVTMPPTDIAVTLSVYGGFFTPALTQNDAENGWTIDHPNLVITAAMRNLEGPYRNTQGYKDLTLVIDKYLEGLELDMIEDE